MKDEDYDYSNSAGYMYDCDDYKVLSQDDIQSLMGQMTEGYVKGSVGQDYSEDKDDE